MIKRDIFVSILLSIVTCGLYGFYWMYHINNDVNRASGVTNATDGATVVLLSIVTCGLYSLYWSYKMGERIDMIKNVQSNTSLIYLLFGLVSWQIIVYGLAQNELNKLEDQQ